MSSSDVGSDFNLVGGAGALPKGAIRQALDAEIAGEGGKVIGTAAQTTVILSNGDQVAWTPPPEKLAIPDISNVKSIRHYFGQRGYQPYPAWLYHPTIEPVLVRNAQEAAQYGVAFRKTTEEERARFNVSEVWDWERGSEWRPKPHAPAKFDPKNAGSGKVFVATAPDPVNAQHQLVKALIPEVAAAVAIALKTNGPAAPANVDNAQWAAFLEFQAWQKTQEVVNSNAAAIAHEVAASEAAAAGDLLDGAGDPNANALTPEQDRAVWENQATQLGIKVDGRWSNERLRTEVEKKLAAA